MLIGFRMQALLEGVRERVPEAFALLAAAEQVMRTWDVSSIYYLAMLTLSKCELWLLQGQIELAQPWLERLSTAYNVQQMDKASGFHPQLALYAELQMALLERALGQVTAAEQRLCGLIEYAQQHDCVVIEQTACVHLCELLLEQGVYDCAAKQLVQALRLAQGGALLAY